jgi:hypothetical protein
MYIVVVLFCAGNINEERLRELLTTMGDRFTDEEVNVKNDCFAQHLSFSLTYILLSKNG